MSLDLDQVRRNYEAFDDFQIEQIAKHEVASLEPEVVPILREEIRKRGLTLDLLKGIEAQTRQFTVKEILELRKMISGLPCPQCGGRSAPLVGVLIREVKSFIFLTNYRTTPVILCPDCGERNRARAMNITLMAGWWGFPWGVFYTLKALFGSFEDRKHSGQQSDDILTNFVVQRIGEITTYLGQDRALTDLVRRANQST